MTTEIDELLRRKRWPLWTLLAAWAAAVLPAVLYNGMLAMTLHGPAERVRAGSAQAAARAPRP
jgi:hypothetical protein